MIPKIIHYCWFGEQNKKKYVNKYINKWKEYLPDYEIIEWNESNFNISTSPQFVREAYNEGKYAFVSDYVRLYVLYKYGGIYLDTDIEIKKSFNDLLNLDYFMGYENEQYIATCVIGSTINNKLIKYFLSYYDGKVFVNPDGSFNTHTNTKIITKMLNDKGIKCYGVTKEYKIDECNVKLFSREFFSPYDYINGRNYSNENTYTIHHFEQSWLPSSLVMRRKLKIFLSSFLGKKTISFIKKIMRI